MNYDGKIRIRSELDNKSFNSQIVETERKLKAQKKTYDAIENRSGSYDGKTESLRKYAVEIEKTTNKLAKLRELQLKVSLGKVSNIQYNQSSNFSKGLSLNTGSIGTNAKGIQSQDFEFVAANVKELKNAFPEVAEEAEKAGQRTKNSFSDAGKSLKRFGLALFGVRTIFSVISKASNSYLSQHSDVAAKMQSIWVALGNLVGPIIERLADGILKIVGYLNVFVKALTNGKIDLTKGMNANTKAIKGTSAAMKELNNQTYSFDEMNVEQDTSSSSSVGSGGGIDTSNFEMPELNQNVVKFLTDMGNILRENKDLVFAIGGTLGIVFGAAKIGGWLTNIGKLIGGSGKGLTGLLGILKPLAAIGVVTVGVSMLYNAVTGRDLINDLKDIYDGLSKLPNVNEDVTNMTKKNTIETKKVNEANGELNLTYEKGAKEIANYINELDSQNKLSKNTIDAKKEEAKSNNVLEAAVKGVTGQTRKAKEIEEEHIQRIINNTNIMGKYASQNKLTDDQLKTYTDTVSYLTTKEEEFKEKIKETYSDMNMPENIKQQQLDYYNGMLKQIDGVKQVASQTKISTGNQKTYFESLWTKAKETFTNMNSLKANPTVEIKTNTKKLTSIFDTIIKAPGLSPSEVSGFTWVTKTLKNIGLAHGAILNVPGRGVPVGYNLVSGEQGREAYMPLSDPAAMSELGYEIGKNVRVSLTNNNYLNNRLISRENKMVENQNAYLTNGRSF